MLYPEGSVENTNTANEWKSARAATNEQNKEWTAENIRKGGRQKTVMLVIWLS